MGGMFAGPLLPCDFVVGGSRDVQVMSGARSRGARRVRRLA